MARIVAATTRQASIGTIRTAAEPRMVAAPGATAPAGVNAAFDGSDKGEVAAEVANENDGHKSFSMFSGCNGRTLRFAIDRI